MDYTVENIQLKEENGHELLVLTVKPHSIFDEVSLQTVIFDECVVESYKACIKEYGSFEKLPVEWKILTNVISVPVQLNRTILLKGGLFVNGDTYPVECKTSTVTVLCRYTVDEELVVNKGLKDAVRWISGWSPEERVRYYDNFPVVDTPNTTA